MFSYSSETVVLLGEGEPLSKALHCPCHSEIIKKFIKKIKKNLSSKCRCFNSFLTCTLILLHRSLRQETQKHTNIVQACGKPEKFLTLKEGKKISIRRKQPKTVIGHDCSDCHQSVLLALPELLKKSMEFEAHRGNTVLTRL